METQKSALKKFNDLSAQYAEISAKLSRVAERKAAVEAQRCDLAAERQKANLAGKTFTRNSELRDINDDLEGLEDALKALDAELTPINAALALARRDADAENAVADISGHINEIVGIYGEADAAFKTAVKAVAKAHVVLARAASRAESLGSKDAFSALRASHRNADRIMRILSDGLQAQSYGTLQLASFTPEYERSLAWTTDEEKELRRELQGVVASHTAAIRGTRQ